MAMERRIRPVHHARNQAMLERIDVHVIDVRLQVALVTDRVFPEPRLPGRRLPGRDAPRSEEHTSELQSLMRISYAVFCLKTKINHPATIQQPPSYTPTIHT